MKFIQQSIEQGKTSMRMDKVNQILHLFGAELVPGRKVVTEI